jgi:hypothetical protein
LTRIDHNLGQIICPMTTKAGCLTKAPIQYGFPNQLTIQSSEGVVNNQESHKLITFGETEDTEKALICLQQSYNTLIDGPEKEEPATYKQACKSADIDNWKMAMDEEMDALSRNNTWEVVPIPKDRHIVGSKWVFKIKRDEQGAIARWKARLVAQGYSQQPGIDYDEIYSPVVRFDSLRLLIALAAHHKWRPQQLDIKAAFLYGYLKEEIYMQLPEGHRQDSMCAKLKKCIYGLKQSPREWYARLTNHLLPLGFAVSTFDPCVLIDNTGRLFISIYVDDITLFGPSGKLMDSTKAALKQEFEVTDLGDLHWILGIQITYTTSGITLSQTAYIDKILSKFGLNECNTVSTPLDINVKLERGLPEDKPSDMTKYQQIIGSLMYAVIGTRPDLAFTVTLLSQFSSCPNATHMGAAKRVLRYLKGSRERKLFYPYQHQLSIEGFSDSDYGADATTRRSTSGYIFKIAGCTISWRARKQRSVATSTQEAEYMALAMAAKQQIWLQRALVELGYHNIPQALSCDNTAAIDLANNPRTAERSKHIDIQYHFVRELVLDGTIVLLHIDGENNPADLCTKRFPLPRFTKLLQLTLGDN